MGSAAHLEVWFTPAVILSFFFYFFIQSLLILGDLVTSNPLFEKRRVKHVAQFASFNTKAVPVIIIYYCILFCKNAVVTSTGVDSNIIYLPVFYVFLYAFLLICEKLFYMKSRYCASQAQHTNTSGLFIVAFIPVSTATISASSVLEMLLPLELLGFLFYFIFLEFNFIGLGSGRSADKQKNSVVMRGLMYYFWLSFVGSLLFVVALFMYSTTLPTLSFSSLSTTQLLTSFSVLQVCAPGLIFIAITLKMGGLFFFFFKADLYKYLPTYGVLLFSVYTAFFYLVLLIYLGGVLPFFGVSFKYLVSCGLVAATVFLVLSSNLSQKNTLTLAALSSVLTLCLCIIVVVS